MTRFLYTVILYLCVPLILLRLLLRARKAPAYAARWSERFGFFELPQWLSDRDQKNQKIIWLHAVSVGETIAATPLIDRLLADDDSVGVVITTTTPTGSEQVHKIFKKHIQNKRVFHVYAPYDLPDCIARFLQKTKPDLYVIMETELWPNSIGQCAKKNIPVVLANGRLSEKSAKGYKKIKWLIEKTFSQLSFAAIQYKDDAERMLALGLKKECCEVTGNIKFDLSISDEVRKTAEVFKTTLNQTREHIIWIAASTHAGEDEIIIEAYKAAKLKVSHLLLVLVPRHPERFSAVASLCEVNELQVQQRSRNEPLLDTTDVLVGDTMGELLALLGSSDIAFIAGSLVPVGGHNIIEPAAWGLPILTGPHLFNFTEASQLLLAENAMKVVENSKQLGDTIVELSENKALRKAMGDRARDVAISNRGALDKLFLIIKKMIVLSEKIND